MIDINKLKVGDAVRCIDSTFGQEHSNYATDCFTTGKHYIIENMLAGKHENSFVVTDDEMDEHCILDGGFSCFELVTPTDKEKFETLMLEFNLNLELEERKIWLDSPVRVYEGRVAFIFDELGQFKMLEWE